MMRILLASLSAELFTEMVVHRRPSPILARMLRLEVGGRVFHTWLTFTSSATCTDSAQHRQHTSRRR
jgi:hypothetical protein